MPPMPNVEVSAPATSKWPCRPSVSCNATRPMAQTASPIGTLTNITQRHDTSWVSTPPATSPMAPPAADTVVKRPMARTRWGPSEKTVVSRASEDGAARAAPTPWRARAARSIQPATANPPRSELIEKMAMPARKVRRRPRRSPDRAPEEEEAAEGEQVGIQDPGEPTPGEPEARLDVREGDVDDRGVQHHHELGGEDHEEEHRGLGEPARVAAPEARMGVGGRSGRVREETEGTWLSDLSADMVWE